MHTHSRFINTLWLMLGAALFYFVVIYILQFPTNYREYNSYTPDCITYTEAAINFYNNFNTHSLRPLAIAAFNSVPLWLGASTHNLPIYVWIMQFILWLGQIIIIYNALYGVVSNKWAVLITCSFIINVSNLVFTSVMLSEPLASFLLTSIAAFIISYFKNKQQKQYLVFTCICLGVLAIVRPTFFYLAIIVCLIIIGYFLINGKFLLALVSSFGLMLLAVQCYKMEKQYGNYTLSYIDKMAMVAYLNIRAKQYANDSHYQEERKKVNVVLDSVSLPQMSAFAIADLKNQISHNSFNIMRSLLFSLYENSTFGCSVLKDIAHRKGNKWWLTYSAKALYILSRLQNILYSISAILLLPLLYYYKRHTFAQPVKSIYSSLLIFPIYVLLLSAVSFYQMDRFHIIVVPIILILWAIIIHKFSATNHAKF